MSSPSEGLVFPMPPPPDKLASFSPTDQSNSPSTSELMNTVVQKHDQQEKLKKLKKSRENSNKPKNFLILIYGTQLGVAILVMVIIIMILYLLNPSFTQKTPTDSSISTSQSISKVLILSGLCAITTFMVPECIKLYSKWKSDK